MAKGENSLSSAKKGSFEPTSPDDGLASVERAEVRDEVLVPSFTEVDVLTRVNRWRQQVVKREIKLLSATLEILSNSR